MNREDVEERRRFVEGEVNEILPGATMVKLGGHFPGSSMLHWNDMIVSSFSEDRKMEMLTEIHIVRWRLDRSVVCKLHLFLCDVDCF